MANTKELDQVAALHRSDGETPLRPASDEATALVECALIDETGSVHPINLHDNDMVSCIHLVLVMLDTLPLSWPCLKDTN
jgi:hypothetical protein